MKINKIEVIQLLEAALQESCLTTQKGYQTAMNDARAAEGAMQSRYSSAKEENQELAQGFILKMRKLEQSLALLNFWKSELKQNSKIVGGSLVELQADDQRTDWYFLFPVGGYECITNSGQKITTLNVQAPLGKLMLYKQTGDKVTWKEKTYKIISVI